MDDKTKDSLTGIATASAKTAMLTTAIVAGGPLAAIAAGLAAELVGVVIPNFRQERFEKLLAELEVRLIALEGEEKQRAEERQLSPEFADLFEDVTRQAVRSLSAERIKQLAQILINGLTAEDMDHARRKRILDLLGQINDVEVLILQGYALDATEFRAFWSEHPELIVESNTYDATRATIDRNTIVASYRQHLMELNLLRPNYQKPAFNKSAEFDYETGRVKSTGAKITSLGRLLIHEIGLREPRHEALGRDGKPQA